MPRLKLSFLGSPQVELDGAPAEIGSNKALALLAYLATTGQGHSRDTLSVLLWPDSDQSRARTYLRHTLWTLKRALEDRWLHASRGQISFQADASVWLDVQIFRESITAAATHTHPIGQICAACLAQLQKAADLYRDSFLAGFTLPDAPAYDEWQFFQAEELRQLFAGVLERLVQEYEARASYDTAIRYARRRLALDPLDEPVQRTMMRLYALAGQQAAALRQYQECVRLLEAELGVTPEDETTALYESIKARQLAPTQQSERHSTAAIDQLTPVLIDNPADERAHRELMRLYALSGRRHDALRQYQACVKTLAARNMRPAPETEALYWQIMTTEPPASSAPDPRPTWATPAPITSEIRRSIPLAGRNDELIALQNKLQITRHGQGRTILLAGEAGVGKTRLAYELLQTAASAHMTLLFGAAYEQESHLPYQPFIEAFDSYLTEQNHPPTQNPITHYKPIGANDVQQEHSALFKAAADFLAALARHAPVVFLLDDLHAADEASLGLFHYLARQTQALPIVLLATYRTDVATPPTSPFGRLLNAFYREQLSDILHLTRLSHHDSATIITHVLGGTAEPALVQTILEIAEGNPFFTQEITRALLKAGHLFQEAGEWRLRSGATPLVPTQLREFLRERVQRLGPEVEPVLTAAAVIGREFRFPVLRAVASLPDHTLLDALDAALEGAMLEETSEGYRFRHMLIRQTLYESLSHTRRRWLHTRTAEAIESLASARSSQHSAEALAFHYNRSDQRERALPYLLQAGQRAFDIYALEMARDHFEQALQLMDELGVDEPEQRWQALERLGRCAYILADTQRAVACFEQALALEATDRWQPDPDARLQLRLLAAFALTTIGDMAAADRYLEQALAERGQIQEESSEYAYLLYNIAVYAWHRFDYLKAYEAAQRSLEVAQRLNDPEAIARGYEMLALTAHSLGDWQQGRDFEALRTSLLGQAMDVTYAFDAHL